MERTELLLMALAAFGGFFAGFAAGSWAAGAKGAQVLLELTGQPKESGDAVLQPTATADEAEDVDALRRAEEDARIQKLLDNIEAFGTSVPQQEIEPRRDS